MERPSPRCAPPEHECPTDTRWVGAMLSRSDFPSERRLAVRRSTWSPVVRTTSSVSAADDVDRQIERLLLAISGQPDDVVELFVEEW